MCPACSDRSSLKSPSLFAFDNTYVRLGDRFCARVSPTPVAAPVTIKLNRALAEQLGADTEKLATRDGAEVLAGNTVPEGAEPIAMAYAGHQFGVFVRQLGDGRAILLGEVIARDGCRRDVQLKGAGRTPFSRGGDGRAALGPVLREYVVSEAMASLGVATTRALAAVMTGQEVLRDQAALPGAILVRVAASHIRVGTFQFFAARGDREALAALTRYALERHYPGSAGVQRDALALLERVVEAQATLVARWIGLGFVHGVMNTDNTTISGETIDYGPCAFLDEYDPEKTFSSIDDAGRYAFGNQPQIARWNVARLAEALLGLIDEDEERAIRLAIERIERFAPRFEAEKARVLRAKLGLGREEAGDDAVAEDLLARLAANEVDYTLFFRRLCDAAASPSVDPELAALFRRPEAYGDWASLWRSRLALDDRPSEARQREMRRANPAFIPRNHRIEEAIRAAVDRADFQPFETLVRTLARPYDDQPDAAFLARPPAPEQRVRRTFCGT
ncbi:MAG TPA: YdiU family protein [Polyangiaceae bacterium]|nr:YdiU family protein [Polyangiaceae bacterium]